MITPKNTARLFAILTSLAASLSSPLVHAQTVTPLWPEAPAQPLHAQPEASEDKRETGRLDRWISYVSTPALTLYPAPPSADGRPTPAVLVIPGGGFRYVCIDKEGIEAAQWLNSLGITAAVLKYRTLNPKGERSGKTIEALLALGDTERAMRVLRANAADWKIDPQRIGIMGFSAGGVMSLKLLIDSDSGNSSDSDPVEKVSSRPDFIALVYTGLPGGKWPKVDASTPPVFLAHAADDPKAPAIVAAKIFQHLSEGGASAELHIFSKGDHGFGVLPKSGSVRSWTASFADWLRDQQVLSAASPQK